MVRQRRLPAEPTLTSSSPTTADTPVRAPAPRVILTEKGNMAAAAAGAAGSHPDDERRTLLGERRRRSSNAASAAAQEPRTIACSTMSLVRQNQWIVLAVASGACAAFNGVFAKLTTGDHTTSFAQGVAGVLHLEAIETAVEYIVRAIFFGLNLLFNGVMWALFTQALARGSSTTQVSIMNTSSNFFITALMGLIIFSESLPPLWWAGAALLVAGNVIIGRQDDNNGKPEGGAGVAGAAAAASAGQDGLGHYEDVPQREGITDPALKEDEDEDVIQLGNLDE